ncbi:dentin sialophosphoprotein-like [Dreissena polymorpha]|uniref:dentin sialophosphoprotein-like n=1 Tax=Dreissena polymorpha TaxID=45954 RepID=UPI0022652ED4|nr:dentin sialophosphoprotein-like [Dreissena polymorpha]
MHIKLQVDGFSISSSSSHSPCSESGQRRPALRDRNKQVDYNDSANLKKQLRGATVKRKRPVKTTGKEHMKEDINFSDFDNYSLVISDSPVDGVKPVSRLSVETSTPLAKRTRRAKNIQVTDLSHIEAFDSPVLDTGYSSVQTPESGHSASIFNTPSLCSSVGSRNCSSPAIKSGNIRQTRANCLIQLHKLSHVSLSYSGSSKSHATQSRLNCVNSNIIDNSASLFSSPGLPRFTRVTAKLQKLQNSEIFPDGESNESDQSEGEEEVSSDESSDLAESKEEDEFEEDVLDEEDEIDESEEEGEDQSDDLTELSAIHEGEELTDEEDSNESEQISIPNDQSNTSQQFVRVTRNTCKKNTNNKAMEPSVDFEKLSESLLSNHINERRVKRKTRRKVVADKESVDEISQLMEQSYIKESCDSNTTLYSLATDGIASTQEQDESDEVEEENHDEDYNDDDNDVDDDDYDDYDGDAEGKTEEDKKHPCTPPRKKYSLKDSRLQELQNSFSEILTPGRRKSSLVPLSAQARVLLLCDQTEPITFRDALPGKMLSKCKKVGEGVYGEVFRSTNQKNESVAIKIIPIEGDLEVNDEPQKKFAEILPEIVIAKELSGLSSCSGSRTASFCRVNAIHCVQGKYPLELLKHWDLYHKNKGSENDRPDMFPEHQLYIMFEFEDCGTSLESYELTTISQGKSVLTQVAYALAVAEERLQFEHRDLHVGNVLVRATDQEEIAFKLLGRTVTVPSMGIQASVIDFTLSRLTKDGCTVFTNLAEDDTLFQGKGDYQFDIYRTMRKENSNNWERFVPHSNVHWLHYLADKVVYRRNYPSQSGRQDRDTVRQFRQFMSGMLEYNSALEMVVDSLFLNT